MQDKFVHLGLGWIGDKGGGLERYQHGICSTHSDLDCDVTAWVQSRVEIDDKCNYSVVAFASPEESRAVKLHKLKAVARARYKARDFSLVSHHASVSWSLRHVVSEVPHIIHFHGPWADEAQIEGEPWWKTTVQRYQERRMYCSADAIITLSDAFKNVLVRGFNIDSDRVKVVPGAIDSRKSNPNMSRSEARKRMGWPADRPIVLSIRRLVRRVGVDILVDAISHLVKTSRRYSDLLVIIGGAGPLRDELCSRVKIAGLEKNVQLTGFIPDELLSTAYRAADISVVPTQSLEGFGLITLESLAAGTPCVVTPVGSLPEILNGLDPALVMPGKSAADIAQGLHAYLSGDIPMPNDEMCRRFVEQNYDWSVIGPRVLSIYRDAAQALPVVR